MNFNDLDLKKIKKTLNFKKASLRYHNKHKDGSGNFGTNLTKGTWGEKDWENWEISGEYDNNKNLYVLRFGKCYGGIGTKYSPDNIEEFIGIIQKHILESKLYENKEVEQ
jgi:hypothetical protein